MKKVREKISRELTAPPKEEKDGVHGELAARNAANGSGQTTERWRGGGLMGASSEVKQKGTRTSAYVLAEDYNVENGIFLREHCSQYRVKNCGQT